MDVTYPITKEVLLQPSMKDKEVTSIQEGKNILEKDNSMSKDMRRWKRTVYLRNGTSWLVQSRREGWEGNKK